MMSNNGLEAPSSSNSNRDRISEHAVAKSTNPYDKAEGMFPATGIRSSDRQSNSVLFIGLVFGFVELVRGPIYEDCYSCAIIIAVLSLFIATLLAWVILNNQARSEINLRSAPEHLLRIFLLGILFPVIPSVLPPMKLKPVLMLGMWIIYLFIAVAAYRKKKMIQLLTNYLRSRSSTTEEQHIKHHSDGSRFGLGHMVDLNRSSTSLVSSSPMGKNMVLNYIPPNVIDGEEIARPSQATIEAANPKWKDCVFGYFIGEQPSFRKIKKAAKKYWGPMGLTEVISNESGFFFFHIPDAAARLRIIEQGVWMFCARPMLLQQWTPSVPMCRKVHDKVPVWVRMHRVPLSLWSGPGLSELASLLGRPMYADSMTEQMARLGFARVCVEMDATRPFKEKIPVMLGEETIWLDVDYQWKPPVCAKCRIFGHNCKAPKFGKRNNDSWRHQGSQRDTNGAFSVS